jgi:amino acid permease
MCPLMEDFSFKSDLFISNSLIFFSFRFNYLFSSKLNDFSKEKDNLTMVILIMDF